MIRYITALEFNRRATAGRTGPSFITGELDDGMTVEVLAKFSASFDEGNVNLARELIGSCLAGDLGLPVPEPFLIRIPEDWAATIPDAETRHKVENSVTVGFGTRVIANQFSVWTPGNVISDIMMPTAAAILVFDAIIQNPDRRSVNPNCLVRGNELRIFDHELAFAHGIILGWVAPWVLGGLQLFVDNGYHIFREGLRGRDIDFPAIRDTWTALSNDRVDDYIAALPAEWTGIGVTVERAIKLIKDARDNIDGCLDEVRRVLT